MAGEVGLESENRNALYRGVCHARKLIPPLHRFWARLSPRAHFMLSAAALLSVLLIVFAFNAQKPSAAIELSVEHGFRTAELSVWIDGALVHERSLAGAEVKRFGVFGKKIEGNYSKTLAVSAGRHTVRVGLSATGFERSREASVVAASGTASQVVIVASRGELSIAVRNAVASEGREAPMLPGPLQSLVLTISGSALSACIGFFIQEFLRGRKARIGQSSSSSSEIASERA